MDELQRFYDVMAPRVESALAYLDRVPLDQLGPVDRRLLDLCLSLTEVALAVEKYKTPLLAEAPYSMTFEIDTRALG
jgi:hypothetical protein